MASQLPADCLNEIFEHLDDKVDLRSCSLVNRLWCTVSVRILWIDIRNYNTLFDCLPKESKEILYKNGIFPAYTSKPPLFNYATFIKRISVDQINREIHDIGLDNDKCILLAQELFKMLMKQTSLKNLYLDFYYNMFNINFTTYLGATDSLRDLSELICLSNISSKFFYQLSQICHSLKTLRVTIKNGITSELMELISVQRNLMNLWILNFDGKDLTGIMDQVSDNLIRFHLNAGRNSHPTSLSFFSKFTKLRELVLSIKYNSETFKIFRHVIFSQLQVLKLISKYAKHDHLTKFLENNGKNLLEIYLDVIDVNPLNSAISKYCPNLKSLDTMFNHDGFEILKTVFNNCQQLESVGNWCGDNYYLNETEILDFVAKYSPKNLYELKLHYVSERSELFTEGLLESALTTWSNRIPQRSLSLVIIDELFLRGLEVKKESTEVIEKFNKPFVIRQIRQKNFSEM